jgi:hypothetical protein
VIELRLIEPRLGWFHLELWYHVEIHRLTQNADSLVIPLASKNAY